MEEKYRLIVLKKDEKKKMYGNINSREVDPQMYECACAICDCACSCGFCVYIPEKSRKNISKLEKNLNE